MEVSRQPTWNEEDHEMENGDTRQICDDFSLQLELVNKEENEMSHQTMTNELATGPEGGLFLDKNGFQDARVTLDGEILENKEEEEEEEEDNDYDDDDDDENISDGDHTPGGRYFGGPTGSNQRCFKCGIMGHISRECPESTNLPCFLCGGRDHQRRNCPEEICYNCGHVGHKIKQCPKRRKRRMSENDFCNRCGMPGHLVIDCSLSWRRYNFARELTGYEVERADSLASPHCYNCASAGHFGDECPNRRKPEYSIFHRPRYEFLRLTTLIPDKKYHDESNTTRRSPKRHQSQEPISGHKMRQSGDEHEEGRLNSRYHRHQSQNHRSNSHHQDRDLGHGRRRSQAPKGRHYQEDQERSSGRDHHHNNHGSKLYRRPEHGTGNISNPRGQTLHYPSDRRDNDREPQMRTVTRMYQTKSASMEVTDDRATSNYRRKNQNDQDPDGQYYRTSRPAYHYRRE